MGVFTGDVSNNEIIGTVDDDTLAGGLGDDFLAGDNGSDTYLFNLGDGHDFINNFDGITNPTNVNPLDRLVFGAGISPSDIKISTSIDDYFGNQIITLSIMATNDSVSISGWDGNYNPPLVDFMLNEINFVDGTVWTKEDIIFFIDSLTNDIVGDESNNQLMGTLGNDSILGEGGNDTLIGGMGNDELKGGLGNDTYKFGRGDGQDVIVEQNATQENNRLIFNEGISIDDILLYKKNINDLLISIKNTQDSVLLKNYFKYNGEDNFFIKEFLFYNDVILNYSQIINQPIINIISETDLYNQGTRFNDYINGNSKNNDIYAGEGQDTLNGAGGLDTLVGGSGNDVYFFDKGNNIDIIFNGFAVQEHDQILFGENITINSLEFIGDEQYVEDLTILLKETNDKIVLKYHLSYRSDVNYIQEFKFSNGVILNFDYIKSLPLLIKGDQEDNSLNGLNGDDTFVGGLGNDTLKGGNGYDTYIFNIGDGHDKLFANYKVIDNGRILFGEGINPEDIDIYKPTSTLDLRIDLKSGDSINLMGGLIGYLPVTDIEFANGIKWSLIEIVSNYINVKGTMSDDYVSGWLCCTNQV